MGSAKVKLLFRFASAAVKIIGSFSGSLLLLFPVLLLSPMLPFSTGAQEYQPLLPVLKFPPELNFLQIPPLN
ncbi:hypothetical protein D770_07460 [Flammeovirgaceae bacterium 311]|nr:hypothetical protein D770_07460 [Flammeovirgaceae bacterium 311]